MQLFNKSKNKFSDEELLALYNEKGDQEFLAELYTRYTHMVYGVCIKYLKNRDDASDAVMNIYEFLSNNVHKHRVMKFSTWLYVATKNHCLMELRSKKTKDKHQQIWQEDQQLFVESKEFLHPIDDGAMHEKQLKLCLEQLKREQKNCIELFYYKNKCYMEIAEELKMEEKQVKSYLQNGKRNLKICMEEAHGKEEQ
ncbi:MAG: sigma-70 family RNA polymerase sigma factor [Bacteroidales bacterium]